MHFTCNWNLCYIILYIYIQRRFKSQWQAYCAPSSDPCDTPTIQLLVSNAWDPLVFTTSSKLLQPECIFSDAYERLRHHHFPEAVADLCSGLCFQCRQQTQGSHPRPQNASSPMLVTESGITTWVRLLQPQNALSLIVVRDSGITTWVRLLQSQNVASPMLVTESGITTWVRLLQPWNSSSSMRSTISGICT